MIAIMCFLSLFYDVSGFCVVIAKSSGAILVMNPENCLKRRKSYGSTGQESVKHQLNVAKSLLA